ncbi:MAG: hypothetical protein AAGL96_18625, partial [Pseudomonadota bacterium]
PPPPPPPSFQAEDGILDLRTLLEFRRVLFRSFAESAKRRKRRPKSAVADKAAAAEALALLGQSRIASNLNQLGYHANIGALMVGETEKAQIAEANSHLAAIRALLMQALGKQERASP